MTHDFRSPAFLRAHLQQIIGFYHPRCIDGRGGYFHYYANDGAVRAVDTRALVSSARMIVSYALAARVTGNEEHRAAAAHGVRFLREAHRDARSGAHAWMLAWRDGRWTVADATNHCYGFAHVALAYAHAHAIGIADAAAFLAEHFALMEQRFWEARHGLYADEASADWTALARYRGQNANMHACEAWLAAFEATGDARYLDRAVAIAQAFCERLADRAGGLVWEHYGPEWEMDWAYNAGDFANGYRPWGFIPGHQVEWAKLLLQLSVHRPEPWMLARARSLFDTTWSQAWDGEHGGLVYSLAPDRRVACAEKYGWVQVEAAVAAALLACATGDAAYWDRYAHAWEYCWRHLVDHEHGSWHRFLAPDNRRIAPDKGSGGKDYHVVGACFDLLRSMP